MRRLLLLVFLASALLAAEPERGRMIENVAARSDATQTYTLYLPPSYDAAKKHPLLFVFDPRGRGTFAAEIFRNGADRYGWILISSNQTRSDDDGKANERALAALVPEASRYAVDPRRIYAAGFSGTAILSCALGFNTGAIAGVIGTGGRLVPQMEPDDFPFAHFGAAGSRDFNNREMRAIDDRLEKAGKQHRYVEFEGEHRWFSSDVATEAIRWMELVAMKEHRRATDEAFVTAAFTEDLAQVSRLVDSGELTNALRLVRSVIRAYDGIHPLDEAKEVAARLAADERVRRAVADEQKWDDFEQRILSKIAQQMPALLSRLREAPRVATALRDLEIAALRRHAEKPGAEGRAAARALESLRSLTGFYLPRELFSRHEYAVAAVMLRVATDLSPDAPSVWYNLGAALAQTGDRKGALEALEKAIEHGYRDASHLAADSDYAPLRDDERFQKIVARLRTNWPPLRN